MRLKVSFVADLSKGANFGLLEMYDRSWHNMRGSGEPSQEPESVILRPFDRTWYHMRGSDAQLSKPDSGALELHEPKFHASLRGEIHKPLNPYKMGLGLYTILEEEASEPTLETTYALFEDENYGMLRNARIKPLRERTRILETFVSLDHIYGLGVKSLSENENVVSFTLSIETKPEFSIHTFGDFVQHHLHGSENPLPCTFSFSLVQERERISTVECFIAKV